MQMDTAQNVHMSGVSTLAARSMPCFIFTDEGEISMTRLVKYDVDIYPQLNIIIPEEDILFYFIRYE